MAGMTEAELNAATVAALLRGELFIRELYTGRPLFWWHDPDFPADPREAFPVRNDLELAAAVQGDLEAYANAPGWTHLDQAVCSRFLSAPK